MAATPTARYHTYHLVNYTHGVSRCSSSQPHMSVGAFDLDATSCKSKAHRRRLRRGLPPSLPAARRATEDSRSSSSRTTSVCRTHLPHAERTARARAARAARPSRPARQAAVRQAPTLRRSTMVRVVWCCAGNRCLHKARAKLCLRATSVSMARRRLSSGPGRDTRAASTVDRSSAPVASQRHAQRQMLMVRANTRQFALAARLRARLTSAACRLRCAADHDVVGK